MTRLSLRYLSVILSLICLSLPLDVKSQGDLLITPRRVVFEGNRRSVDLSLANIGKDTATYSISVVQIRMTEDGGFETITEPDEGQKFASPYIRFFPRSVTLKPGEVQTVKIQATRTGDLEQGEYRSHLYFRATPSEKPLGEQEAAQQASSSISIKLIPVFGITIPVILRIGEPTAGIALTDLSLRFENDTIPRLSMTFNRTGNYSVYGDIAVDYISPNGTVSRVGIANGVAVYTPNQKRHFEFNLVNTAGLDLKTGRLRVIYSAPSDVKPEKYAEAELILKQ
jgi:P pilus assembly chaperone PapD